jgi:hypothetical protein
MLNRVPDEGLIYGFIPVPIDVPSRSDRCPIDFRWLEINAAGRRRDASETISSARTTA